MIVYLFPNLDSSLRSAAPRMALCLLVLKETRTMNKKKIRTNRKSHALSKKAEKKERENKETDAKYVFETGLHPHGPLF